MIFNKFKKERDLAKAFKKVFFDDQGNISREGALILAFLRDEVGGRGELGKRGVPYFYDAHNRFDEKAAIFLLGKRRIFDLIIKYLALDEIEIFNLSELEDEDEILNDLKEKIVV